MVSINRPRRAGLSLLSLTCLSLALGACGNDSPTFQNNSLAATKAKPTLEADAVALPGAANAQSGEALSPSVLEQLQNLEAQNNGNSLEAKGHLGDAGQGGANAGDGDALAGNTSPSGSTLPGGSSQDAEAPGSTNDSGTQGGTPGSSTGGETVVDGSAPSGGTDPGSSGGSDGGSDGSSGGGGSGGETIVDGSTPGDGGTGDGGTGDGGTGDGGTGGGTPGNEGLPPLYDYALDLVQKELRKVDILWVVDSSGSMAEEQNYLGNNFNSFISILAGSSFNFQTAITSTDICPDAMPPLLIDRACPVDYGGKSSTRLRGSFVGNDGQKVLKYDTADLVKLFNTNTRVGITGSGFEHGLKAAEMAVEKSLSGANDPLVRSGAFLSIIVVSDEEDDGVGLSQTDAYTGYNYTTAGLTKYRYSEDDLIAYLNLTKGQGNYAVSTITGTRDAGGKLCTSPHSQPLEEGTAYIKAATKTGGTIQSICETNWANSLAVMGEDLTSQITQIHLDHQALDSSIKVTVDGVEVHDWTFVAGSNSIKFGSQAIPPPGSAIHVMYKGF